MDDDELEDECRGCGSILGLNDGYEWPEGGPICYGCLRAALAAEREKAGRLEEISQDYVRVMTERDMYRAEAAEVKRERDRKPELVLWRCVSGSDDVHAFASRRDGMAWKRDREADGEAGLWEGVVVRGDWVWHAAAGLDAGEDTP